MDPEGVVADNVSMNDDRLALLCPMVLSAPVVGRARLTSCASLPLDPRGPVDVHVVLSGATRWARTSIAAGDVLIVRGARDVAHGAANDGGAESLRARYSPDRFAIAPTLAGTALLHVPAAKVAADAQLASLVSLLHQEPSGALAQRVFDVLFIAIERRRLADEEQTPYPLADARIARTIAELRARHAERWTVASMAKHAGMSRAVFARRFAEMTGVPPHAYLARVRIEVARALLRDGDAAVGEVAVRVGYRSESVFSRAFKRIAGEPPALFRKTQRVTARAA